MKKKDPLVYLDQILAASNDAVEFTKDLDFQAFVSNRIVRMATERAVEIMGEAIKRLPMSLREKHAQVDWRGATGLRDKLTHEYDRIDLGMLWHLIRNDLPGLIEQLEDIIKIEEQEEESNT